MERIKICPLPVWCCALYVDERRRKYKPWSGHEGGEHTAYAIIDALQHHQHVTIGLLPPSLTYFCLAT